MFGRIGFGSISFKLVGTFILVTLLGTLINALIITTVTSIFFNRYLDFTGKSMADVLSPQLVAYYQQNGSWVGVNDLFKNRPMPMMNFNGGNHPPPTAPMPMMGGQPSVVDIRFVLLDKNGSIVADNSQGPDHSAPRDGQTANSFPIQVNNETVGTLIVYGMPNNPNSPGFTFITTVTRTTWVTMLIITILGAILGFFIFRQVVSPVRSMTQAAQQIARGDLSQRVKVASKDEVGTLATAFNQMAQTLEQNQQQRRNMTADIAHELRTPISILQANLEAMLDGVLPTSPDEIASLLDESAMLARLVDDLRLLSLAEAGQLKLVKTSASIKDLLEREAELYRSQAEDHQINLVVDAASDLPPVNVDTDRISMVIRNLLNNALRYTPGGGQVTLKASLDENPKQVRVEVIDTGSGIDPQDLPHIFDRFYRADHSRSRSSGGTGIGLAIVKQLVEAHGGSVSVESPIINDKKQVTGTRFWFTIDS
jgi:signal transduction histidine kinase